MFDDIIPGSPKTPALPDPYTQATDHLFAREAQFRDAHRALAEAWVFAAAELLRGQWPTAHSVIFDRTEKNRDAGRPMVFLRVEDHDGRTLAVGSDLPDSEEKDDHEVILAIHHYLVAAERQLNDSGGVAADRVWSIANEYNYDRMAIPPHLCRITLPPAARPHSDPAALPRTSASLHRPFGLDAGDFRVVWTNELAADDPLEAAEEAQRMLRDPDSLSTIFEVTAADGSKVAVDLADGTVHATAQPGRAADRSRPAPSYLADYPHPLPDSLDLAGAHLMPVEQLQKGDVILGAVQTSGSHIDFTPHVPRYADPAPACGACGPDCAMFVAATERSGGSAMHTTAVGQEVTDPEEADQGDPWHLLAFADEIYAVIPGQR